METIELESQVYGALTEDTALMELLPKGQNSVFYLQAPGDERERYPVFVYSPVSDVPVLAADNKEFAHRVTIRIHIITLDGQYGDIYRHIHRIMEGLGFSRSQAQPYVEDGEKILIVDYKIGVDSSWRP